MIFLFWWPKPGGAAVYLAHIIGTPLLVICCVLWWRFGKRFEEWLGQHMGLQWCQFVLPPMWYQFVLPGGSLWYQFVLSG